MGDYITFLVSSLSSGFDGNHKGKVKDLILEEDQIEKSLSKQYNQRMVKSVKLVFLQARYL